MNHIFALTQNVFPDIFLTIPYISRSGHFELVFLFTGQSKTTLSLV